MPVSWEYYSIVAAMISLFIAVLMHMIANGFGLQKLNLWVKSEYMQVGATFLILLLALGVDAFSNNIFGPIATSVAASSGNLDVKHAAEPGPNGNQISPSEIGKAYLTTVIGCERDVYVITYAINFYFETWSRVSFDILGEEPSASGLALGGWVTLFHFMANNMVYLALFQYIQYHMLNFAEYTMLYPFLAIGLVLRAFPATRGAGGLITAFALGFAFIFPMSYVVMVSIMPNVHGGCTQLPVIQESSAMKTLTQGSPCFTNTGEQIENYFKLKTVQSSLSGTIDYLQNLSGLLFLQGMFYPLASLIITFTFIRQTGSLFGADLAEIGRGLIKII